MLTVIVVMVRVGLQNLSLVTRCVNVILSVAMVIIVTKVVLDTETMVALVLLDMCNMHHQILVKGKMVREIPVMSILLNNSLISCTFVHDYLVGL